MPIVFALLSLAACDGTASDGASGDTNGSVSELEDLTGQLTRSSVSVGAGGSELSSAVQPDPDDTSGDDTFRAFDFDQMLVAVGDYQLEIDVSFDGFDQAGAPIAFEWRSRESVIADPPQSRIDLESIQGIEQGVVDSLTLVRYGDAVYLNVPDTGCIGGRAGDLVADMTLPLEPSTLLDGISGARRVGNGIVVNGAETTEFRFDETNVPWSSEGPWSIAGSAFVESESDIPTRVVLRVSGNGDLLGDGQILNGEYNIVIDVTRLVAADAAEIPSACLSAYRYPTTPDAHEITAIDDLLSYRSRMSLEDVVSFYLAEMPTVGWQLLSEPDLFDDLAIMNFQRDTAALMVTLELDSDTGTVSVLISP